MGTVTEPPLAIILRWMPPTRGHRERCALEILRGLEHRAQRRVRRGAGRAGQGYERVLGDLLAGWEGTRRGEIFRRAELAFDRRTQKLPNVRAFLLSSMMLAQFPVRWG